MRDSLLSLVNPIVRTALKLRDEWASGTGPPFDAGRELLIGRFRELFAVVPLPGAKHGASSFEIDLSAASMSSPESRYLGVGYALASWVDELFTLNSPVASQWNERKFEVEFYETNDRAWRFWVQARMAAERATDDDLEVFFLCAVLGFRGEWIEDQTQLRAWLGSTRERLVKSLRTEWVGPPALEPPANVPPRHWKAKLARMAVFAGLTTLVCIPFGALLVARQFMK
jgi:type VI protein secretion system component VasF